MPLNNEPVKVQAFTSLLDDRQNGGGYRRTVTVLETAESRGRLVNTAWTELAAWRRRYERVAELSKVLDAVDSILTARQAAAG